MRKAPLDCGQAQLSQKERPSTIRGGAQGDERTDCARRVGRGSAEVGGGFQGMKTLGSSVGLEGTKLQATNGVL